MERTNLRTIDIGEEFHNRLTNRDSKQRDGTFTGVEFREKYLKELDSKEAWADDSVYIKLDFSNVIKMGPSWANEVFGYFAKYAKPGKILKKIQSENVSRVKRNIIEQEIESGYAKR